MSRTKSHELKEMFRRFYMDSLPVPHKAPVSKTETVASKSPESSTHQPKEPTTEICSGSDDEEIKPLI